MTNPWEPFLMDETLLFCKDPEDKWSRMDFCCPQAYNIAKDKTWWDYKDYLVVPGSKLRGTGERPPIEDGVKVFYENELTGIPSTKMTIGPSGETYDSWDYSENVPWMSVKHFHIMEEYKMLNEARSAKMS